MVAAALLVGTQEVGADDLAVQLGNKDLAPGSHPIGNGVGPTHVSWQGIGFAGTNDGFEYPPDSNPICQDRGPDQ
jgi:hypothetical protein